MNNSAIALVNTTNIARDEWLTWRMRGLGGSDAAAAAGLNPWKSPLTLWMEKRGELPPVEENEVMKWGNLLEPLIAQEFERQSGLKVRRRNAILQHQDMPFMLADVDRLIVGVNEGLEIKTANEYAKEDWEGENIPTAYLLQCAHYMAVTGYQAWWIAVLIGGNKFRFKRIERDEEMIQALIKIEQDFWALVEEGTPPAPDGSESSSNVLDVLYPHSYANTSIELPLDAAKFIAEFDQASVQLEAAKLAQEEAANKLKALLGENETGWIGEHKVVWKSVVSKRIDSKALKADMPSIYDKYAKESESRRFTVK